MGRLFRDNLTCANALSNAACLFSPETDSPREGFAFLRPGGPRYATGDEPQPQAAPTSGRKRQCPEPVAHNEVRDRPEAVVLSVPVATRFSSRYVHKSRVSRVGLASAAGDNGNPLRRQRGRRFLSRTPRTGAMVRRGLRRRAQAAPTLCHWKGYQDDDDQRTRWCSVLP